MDTPTGNLAQPLTALLSQLGVVTTSTDRDRIEQTIDAVLRERQRPATVVAVIDRVVTLETDPTTAYLIRYDLDTILRHLHHHGFENIDRIHVRTRR